MNIETKFYIGDTVYPIVHMPYRNPQWYVGSPYTVNLIFINNVFTIFYSANEGIFVEYEAEEELFDTEDEAIDECDRRNKEINK